NLSVAAIGQPRSAEKFAKRFLRARPMSQRLATLAPHRLAIEDHLHSRGARESAQRGAAILGWNIELLDLTRFGLRRRRRGHQRAECKTRQQRMFEHTLSLYARDRYFAPLT